MAPNKLGRLLDSLTTLVERTEALDKPAEPLSRAAAALTRPRWLVDVLSGTPLGHPLHPLLVTVPIGAWTSALLMDVLGRKENARTLVGFGILAAVPTAVAGLSDWRDTAGAEKRVGTAHALFNSWAISLYAASWLARRSGRHGLGVALSVPAMGLVGASGWLGGHLSYALGVGVDTTAFQEGSDEWCDAGAADDLQVGALTMVDAGGVPVLLTRLPDQTVVAYNDRCTHRGAPLHEGEVVDGCLRCPWHDSEFSLADGSVLHGPATRPQPRFEVRTEAGRLQVRRLADGRSLRENPIGS